MKRSVLALDFGASSGRAILATYDGTAIHLQEVHRFVNEPLLENGHLFWNVPELMNQLEIGLQKAFLLDSYESIGIDTWGVDFGHVGKDGKISEAYFWKIRGTTGMAVVPAIRKSWERFSPFPNCTGVPAHRSWISILCFS